MLERLKALFLSPALWTPILGILVLTIRQIFPTLPLTDQNILELLALVLFTLLGVQIQVAVVRVQRAMMGKK
jgi:hypothetical protein